MFRKRYAISVMPGAASQPYSPTKTMGREKRKSMRKVRSVDTYEKTWGDRGRGRGRGRGGGRGRGRVKS